MTVPAAQGSDSEVLRVLREARARIARGWCRFSEALGPHGGDVPAEAPEAVRWCSNGALFAVQPGATGEAYYVRAEARRLLKAAIGCDSITEWNDGVAASQTDVLSGYDKAIALAEGNAPLAAPPAIPSPAPPETPR